MSSPAKVCIKCGIDCSTKPRTKDAQGRYTCRACFDALVAKAKAAKAAARPAPIPVAEPDDAAVMAALIESSPAADTEMCPSCGSGMAGGSVVCTVCGYNKQTGATVGVHVEKGPSKAAAAALGAASAVGGLAAGPIALILAGVGAAIGGAVGAGVWALVAYQFHFEIGWIAWGVGLLCGAGAAIGARGHSGLFTGVVAALIAVISVLGGKYAAASMTVDDYVKAHNSVIPSLSDDDMISVIASGVAEEHASAGKNYKWPEGVEQAEAHGENEFPAPIWKDAKARWEEMDKTKRDAAIAELQKRFQQAVVQEVKSEGFLATFGALDVLFFLLAVGTAFTVGAGGDMSGSGDD